MKKFIAVSLIAASTLVASAQKPDLFNHLGIGAGVGTTGISIEVATPITSFVQMRAGASFVPGITFNSDASCTYNVPNPSTGAMERHNGKVNLEGDLGRIQGQIIFNVYPVPKLPFYVAVGAYFGGNKLLKITGNSPELAANSNAEAIIGDYKIPADANGNISGGLEVKKFRPYLGIGWGRAIPGRLLNFACDLGVQFQGKPKLYTDYGEIDESAVEDNNTFNKIAKALKVYPTLTFRLNFRAF